MATYKVVRYFFSTQETKTLKRHLSLAEAQAYCSHHSNLYAIHKPKSSKGASFLGWMEEKE